MATPSKVARYRDLKPIGSGGMATVTLAEDTMLGRRVALKRMHTAGDPRGLSRLRREALVGASLNHPNLVAIYDVQTGEDGDLVIVMEYVAGETLRDAVHRRHALPVTHALRVLEGVAAALDAIHQRAIVHRDVKPANILLGTDGAIKLADLGIAAVADRTQITTDGAVLGTFSYMAPEQLEGQSSEPAIDVYALAAVAFEVLSGRKARPEPNPLALAHAISTQPPPELTEAWPQAPAEAAEVLRRGMARDPGQRPRSASELTARLRAALDPLTTAPGSQAPSPARQRVPRAPTPPVAEPVPGPPGDHGRRVPPVESAAAVDAGLAVEAAAPRARQKLAPASRDGALSATSSGATPLQRPDGVEAAAAAPSRSTRSPGHQAPSTGATRPGILSGSRQGRRAPLALAALLMFAVAVLAVVLLTRGGSSSPPRASTAATAPARHSTTPAPKTKSVPAAPAAAASAANAATPSPAPAGGSTTADGASTAAAAAQSPATPAGAVQRFYGLATQHQFAAAWALADPAAQAQLQGFGSFQVQQSQAQAIRFLAAEPSGGTGNSASVAVRTVSLTDQAKRCGGTVGAVKAASGRWMVHSFSISCTPSG